jgi:hypothetical protein
LLLLQPLFTPCNFSCWHVLGWVAQSAQGKEKSGDEMGGLQPPAVTGGKGWRRRRPEKQVLGL